MLPAKIKPKLDTEHTQTCAPSIHGACSSGRQPARIRASGGLPSPLVLAFKTTYSTVYIFVQPIQ